MKRNTQKLLKQKSSTPKWGTSIFAGLKLPRIATLLPSLVLNGVSPMFEEKDLYILKDEIRKANGIEISEAPLKRVGSVFYLDIKNGEIKTHGNPAHQLS